VGQVLPEFDVKVRAPGSRRHKIAARTHRRRRAGRKYNAVIGVAADHRAGDYVHSHNLKLVDFEPRSGFGPDVSGGLRARKPSAPPFMGYVREDGRVGTRNFIGILSSVNCSATVISRIAAHFTPERLKDYPNVDGVAAFPQTTGCGMSSPSPHFDLLRRTLAGYARHPNMAGVLIVGPGLRAQPGRRPGGLAGPGEGPAAAHDGDAGSGRHAGDDRGGHPRDRGDAADRQRYRRSR
jgi:altronate hydrolase